MSLSSDEEFNIESQKTRIKQLVSRFHDFYELFNDIKEISVFEVDTKGFIQSNLRGGSELFGYSQQDLDKGINALELFIPEEREKILQKLSNTVQDVTQEDREYIGLRKDGSTFPVCIYSKPIFKDNRIIGRRGIAIDITDMKEIVGQLKESQEFYQQLIQLSPDGIVLTTLDGQVIMINKQALNLYRAEKESDIIGKHITDFFLPEEHELVSQNVQNLLEQRTISNYEQTIFRMDGTSFPAELSAAVVGDDSNNPKFFLSVIRDISQREESAKLLRKSEEKYRSLTHNLNVAVYRAHMHGYMKAEIVEVNPAFLEMFGYKSLEEILQVGREALFATHEDRVRFNDIMLKEGKTTNLELSLKRKDGTIFIGSVSGVINDNGENKNGYTIWDGIIKDVTDQKLIEKEMIQKNKDFEYKTSEMEKLTYTISHDLKAPLTSINGFIELLTDENGENFSRDSKLYLKRIKGNITRMARIIDDILEYSRFGKVREETGNHSLSQIIKDILVSFTPQLQEKNVRIEVEKDFPDVYVQRERIMQVFENLIDNAIKYMGEKENKTIMIGKTAIQEDFVTLYVKDTGIGMKKEHLHLIFQLFTRIPNGLPNQVSGSGVGLANVQKIIETHGGTIWVESEYEKGTTFYFTIPLKNREISTL